MKITKKFEITITIDTEKANTNSNKFGADYDTNAYPNWKINYAGYEYLFIKYRVEELKDNFKFTGMKCKIKESK
jgi:hypothetical protein